MDKTKSEIVGREEIESLGIAGDFGRNLEYKQVLNFLQEHGFRAHERMFITVSCREHSAVAQIEIKKQDIEELRAGAESSAKSKEAKE